ncbi:MAG: outer membrane protein [Pseudobacter sp.]|uniref:outer membrane protein n=1 Tax=Pseudobacter sp. TaxID=2045420 RepID=UPI003F7D813F
MKEFLTIAVLVLCCSVVVAQEENEGKATDSTPAASSTFTAGALYATNASYYGQKAEEKTPYVALVASYRHRSGFYVNGMAYRLLNDSSKLASAYAAGAGFEFPLSKKLTADVGYSYTFFPTLSPFLQAANPHTASATLTYENWLTASLNVDYTFGKTQDIFVTPAISKQVVLKTFDSVTFILFTPEFNVTAGTQRFYEYYESDKQTRDSLLGKLLDRLPVNLPGNNPNNPNNPGNSGTTVEVKEANRFNLLSYNCKLPLAVYRKGMMFELSCQLSLLGNRVQSRPGKLNTFYGAAFYYQF